MTLCAGAHHPSLGNYFWIGLRPPILLTDQRQGQGPSSTVNQGALRQRFFLAASKHLSSAFGRRRVGRSSSPHARKKHSDTQGNVYETSAAIPYWWRVTTQVLAVLLTGRTAREITFSQSEGVGSPQWGCAGDRVEMVVKVHCGTVFKGTHFQQGNN